MNCQWSDWGPYTECIGVCGTGKRNRTRGINIPSSHGGKDCLGNFTQTDNSCTVLDKPCPGKSQLPVLVFIYSFHAKNYFS